MKRFFQGDFHAPPESALNQSDGSASGHDFADGDVKAMDHTSFDRTFHSTGWFQRNFIDWTVTQANDVTSVEGASPSRRHSHHLQCNPNAHWGKGSSPFAPFEISWHHSWLRSSQKKIVIKATTFHSQVDSLEPCCPSDHRLGKDGLGHNKTSDDCFMPKTPIFF